MSDRTDAILAAAMELASEGGFENVRQREVAERAGVALGTLYKRFRSKEELLAAVLARRGEEIERRMEREPAVGKTVEARLGSLFETATAELCREPNFARAVIRAMASGVPEVAGPIAAYQGLMTGLIIAAIRGRGRLSFADIELAPPTEAERELSLLLLQLWFACQVGWSAGLSDEAQLVAQVRRAIDLLVPAVGLS